MQSSLHNSRGVLSIGSTMSMTLQIVVVTQDCGSKRQREIQRVVSVQLKTGINN